MAGKFERSTGKAGKHRFNLKASNGQVILTSQGYADASGRDNGIESIRKHARDVRNFVKATSSDGKFYFTLKAANGQVIGTSQRYASEASRNNGIDSVMRHASDAKVTDAKA